MIIDHKKNVLLGDIFTVSSGGTPSRRKPEYFGGDIPWIKTGNLKRVYADNPTEFITELGLNNSAAKIFPKNTVLLAMYGATIGACSILPFEAATNQACAAILPNEHYNQKYLYYYLSYIKPSLIGQGVGGAQPNISASIIKKLRIPLPPLPEQKKIAEILDAADSLRQKDQQLVEHYDRLSQSLFLDMFGDPVTNPMGWEKDISIKYSTCIVPGRDKPKSFNGEIPWITTNDLNRLSYTNKSSKDIGLTELEINEVKAKIIPKNSVILTCVGDLGIVTINSQPMVMNQQLHSFQCDNLNISSLFMMYAISYQLPYMNKMASSTTVPYMNKTVCNNIPMIYPPIGQQKIFEEKIKLIEKQKELAQQSLKKSDDLFNSLLQRAFKGEL